MNERFLPHFYPTIADVLNEKYQMLVPLNPALDEAVKTALPTLSSSYRDLTGQWSPPPDYSQPATRVAYVFSYAGAHAYYTFDLLTKFEEYIAQELASKSSLQITSLGGGPGSDLLGLLLFLRQFQQKFDYIHCIRCDRVPDWKWTSELMLSGETYSGDVTLDHEEIDVTKSSSYKGKDIFSSDLFIASYFLSELLKPGITSDDFWITLGKRAKSGALFFLIDSDSDYLKPDFEKIMGMTGFQHILTVCEPLSHKENTAFIQSYIDRYNRNPRMHGQLYFAIYRKT